jgi:hypothetical protein
MSTQGLKYPEIKGRTERAIETELAHARAERLALRRRIEAIEKEAYRGHDA